MLNSIENDLAMAYKIASMAKEAGGSAYFVGGCVRDELMGMPLKDIDIEVHGITPKTLSDILDTLGEKLVIGVSFGVFGLRGYDIDIAMPRTEKATGRGHRDFEIFVDPFLGVKKAAERRDFTVNAMMKDVLTGEITDCFNGREDLKNGIIRHVNDVSFVEDPLRVFRAAQFASRFGFEVDDGTVKLCSKVKLDALPSERVFSELEKALLLSEKPSVFFEVLRKMDQLGTWFPELGALIKKGKWEEAMRSIDLASALRKDASYPEGFMLSSVCSSVADDDASGAEKLLKRLTSERKLIRYVKNMTALKDKRIGSMAKKRRKLALFRVFDKSAAPSDLILFCRCASRDPEAGKEGYMELMTGYLEKFDELMSRPFVSGKDLIDAGIEPGTTYSDILSFAHDLRLKGTEKSKALKLTVRYAESLKK